MADIQDRLIYTIEVKDFASKPLEAIKKQLQGFDSAIVRLSKIISEMNNLDMAGFKNLASALDPFLASLKDIAPLFAQAAKGFNQWTQEAKKAAEETKATAQEIEKNTKTWKSWQETLKDAGASILKGLDNMAIGIENFIKNGANIDKLVISGFKNFIGIVAEAGTSLLNFGLNIAKTAFDGLVNAAKKGGEIIKEFVVDSVKAYANFEESLGGARRTMDLTDDSLKYLITDLQNLSMNFEEGGLKAGVTTDALAEIAGIAGQMGISITENEAAFNKFVETIAKTSVTFEMSAGKTADALGILSNVYDVPIEKADELAGAITIVGQSSIATVPQLLDFMQRVGSQGAVLGLTAEQAATLGGAIREGGLSVEVAGTAIGNIFTKLQTDVGRFAEVLKSGGIDEAMLRTAINSKNAGAALQMVVEALIKMSETNPSAAAQAMKDLGISGSRGVAVLQTLLAQFPQYKQFLEDIADPTANAAALSAAYEQSLQGLNRQWDATKNIVTIIYQLIGKNLSNALSTLLEKHLNPLLLRFQEWIKDSPVAQAILTELGRVIETIGGYIGKAGEAFMKWLEGLDEVTANTKIHEWFSSLLSNIEKIATTIMTTNWGQKFENAWDSLSKMVKTTEELGDKFVSVSRTFEDWYNVAKEFFGMTSDQIKEFSTAFGWAFDEITSSFNNWLGGMARGIDDFVSNSGQAISNMFQEMIGWVEKLSTKIADTLSGGAFSKLLGMIKKTEDEAITHSLFPDMVDWAGKTAEAIDKTTQSADNLGNAIYNAGNYLPNLPGMPTPMPIMQVPSLSEQLPKTLGISPEMLKKYPTLARQYEESAKAWEEARQAYYRITGLPDPKAAPPQTAINSQSTNMQPSPLSGEARTQGFKNNNRQTQGENINSGTSIVINAGANLVDDYALGQFAETIGKKIQESGKFR